MYIKYGYKIKTKRIHRATAYEPIINSIHTKNGTPVLMNDESKRSGEWSHLYVKERRWAINGAGESRC